MMVAAAPKRLLLLIRHSPYGSSLARASLDVALAAAAFDQPVTLLFAGDGVLQLLPEQDTHARGVKNIGCLLASLPLYGIEQVYVDAQAVAHYQFALDTAPLKAVPLDSGQISEMFRNHDQLLGF